MCAFVDIYKIKLPSSCVDGILSFVELTFNHGHFPSHIEWTNRYFAICLNHK